MADFGILYGFGRLAKRLRGGSGVTLSTPESGVVQIDAGLAGDDEGNNILVEMTGPAPGGGGSISLKSVQASSATQLPGSSMASSMSVSIPALEVGLACP